MKYFLIILGGGIGSLCRYLTSSNINNFFGKTFPLGTLAVNLIGCFIIGFLYALFERVIISPNLRLFIFVGFLGGFTTFSSLGLETFNLLKSSEYKLALTNILVSNIAGLVLVFAGYMSSNYLLEKLGGK